MRYFLDTEFSERGPDHPIRLISIALVAEDGREFYAVSGEFYADECSPWVQENVLPHLLALPPCGVEVYGSAMRSTRSRIADALRVFCDPAVHGKPEFWGYFADYDWVVLCQLFGAMVHLPQGWPKHCKDLKQDADFFDFDVHALPKAQPAHNALADARWLRDAFMACFGAVAREVSAQNRILIAATQGRVDPNYHLVRIAYTEVLDEDGSVECDTAVFNDGESAEQAVLRSQQFTPPGEAEQSVVIQALVPNLVKRPVRTVPGAVTPAPKANP